MPASSMPKCFQNKQHPGKHDIHRDRINTLLTAKVLFVAYPTDAITRPWKLHLKHDTHLRHLCRLLTLRSDFFSLIGILWSASLQCSLLQPQSTPQGLSSYSNCAMRMFPYNQMVQRSSRPRIFIRNLSLATTK